MTSGPEQAPDRTPHRGFRRLLLVYPKRFRDRFAVGMQYAFANRLRDVRRDGKGAVAVFWLRSIWQVLYLGIGERLRVWWISVLGTLTRPSWSAPINRDRNTESMGTKLMRSIERVRQDLLYALRALAKRPGMAGLAIVTFALGIAASSALFSVIDSVLLRPLPYPNPEEIVSIYPTTPELRGHPTMGWMADRATFSWPEFADVREHQQAFSDVAAFSYSALTVFGDGPPERITVGLATYELFTILGAVPLHGRLFNADDNNRTGERVLMLQEDYWRSRFAADPAIVGSEIRIDDQPFTVVGVLPSTFRWTGFESVSGWIPMAGTAADGNRGNHNINGAIARLAPGMTMTRAQEDLARVIVETNPPDHGQHGASVFPRHQDETRRVRPPLIVLMVASFVLLAVACGNVAALLLGAGIERNRELAVRGALGASRGRIAQQLLTETLVIAGLGAALGIGLAAASTNLLLSFAPDNIPRIGEATLNVRVVAFAVLVSLGSGVLFGLIPALSLSRTDLAKSLQSSRGAVEGRTRLQAVVVAGELTLATVLLVSGALLSRTLVALNGVDVGFEPEGLLSVGIATPYQRFGGEENRAALDAYFQRIVDEASSIPGVLGVAVTSHVALSNYRGNNNVHPEGWDETSGGEVLVAERRFVSVNYFDVMQIPIVEGRAFDVTDDRADAPPSVIISESLARRAWPRETALGKQFGFWGGDYTVVGVARDLRDESVDTATELAFYAPLRQMRAQTGALLIRTDGDPMSIVPTLRERVFALHPDLPVTSTVPMLERMGDSVGAQRYRARLMAVFAGMAGLFAFMGIYGITARSVARRTREMGIRVALGAERTQVMRLVLRQGVRLSAIGVLAGIVVSLLTGRLIESMLFGVSTSDPLTLGGIAALVVGASVLASLPPAYRATRVDPMVALRNE
ncbi:MAG: ABC transporter permease [Gemmatimonadetes bacterium]|nr:ABC transporter permease [Gemmatimonadota bacterium]